MLKEKLLCICILLSQALCIYQQEHPSAHSKPCYYQGLPKNTLIPKI